MPLRIADAIVSAFGALILGAEICGRDVGNGISKVAAAGMRRYIGLADERNTETYRALS